MYAADPTECKRADCEAQQACLGDCGTGQPAFDNSGPPYTLDGMDPKLRGLVVSAVHGAIAFGGRGDAPPPAGHWLKSSYDIGAAERALRNIDWFGLALDLESASKKVESQTAERAMLAAASAMRRLAA